MIAMNKAAVPLAGAASRSSSRRPLWQSALAQLRLDATRVGSFGPGDVLLLLGVVAISLLLAVLTKFAGMDVRVASGLIGGITGLSAVAGWSMALGPSVMEDQNGHRAMAGLVPIARTPQVIGRFFYLLYAAALWSVTIGVCNLVFDALLKGGADFSDFFAPCATVFAAVVVFGSIMLACTYRFGVRQLMIVAAVIMGSLYLLMALLSFLPVAWQSVILTVFEFLSVPWHAVLVGVVLCVVAYGASLFVAIRIFNAKDL
ncbi:hypothetical protein BG22_04990 [Bifidobacterium sp. UTBIF-78]|nr:hypothetical protein BG22_04990 [Bifidobacterium sp. UTBIF-78]